MAGLEDATLPEEPIVLASAEPSSSYKPAATQPQTEEVPAEKHGLVLRNMKNLMKDFGMSPHRAAGVLGNGAHETNWFSDLSENKSKYTKGSGGEGWFQWTGDRRDDFRKYANSKRLNPASEAANYGYLKKDLAENPEHLASMAKTPHVDQATAAFMNSYERPNAKVAHLESRLAKARGILKLYGERANTKMARR
jgi:Phage tail lysozyme